MKRLIVLAFVAVATLIQIDQTGFTQDSGTAICDPKASLLCSGLLAVFKFQEANDDTRIDSVAGLQAFEPTGYNVGTAAGKISANSISFAGTANSYLYIPRFSGLGASRWTVALWIYPTSNSTTQVLLSHDEPTNHGAYLTLVPSGSNVSVVGTAYYLDQDSLVSVTSNSTLSLNAWHLIVWGAGTTWLGVQQMSLQVDNGTPPATTTLSYQLQGNTNGLYIGKRNQQGNEQPYSGQMEQLTLAGVLWDANRANLFWNSGAGLAYPFAATSTASLNQGLVAYFKMEEPTGSGSRLDAVGQHNLTASGTVNQVTGKLGYAASPYNGTSYQALTAANASDLQVGGVDFSVAGWVYPTSTAAGPILEKDDYGGWHGEYDVEWSSGQFGFNTMNAGAIKCSVASQTGLSLNAWHFVAATYTVATHTCLIQVDNGTAVTSTATGSVDPVNTTYSVQFGLAASYFTGYVDEWGLWKNHALSATERASLWNSGSGLQYPF
jgi:hypothetical protein